jgi:hypothetical protein
VEARCHDSVAKQRRYNERQAFPINAARDGAVKDTQQCIGGNILFGLDISECAVDQQDNQMTLVGIGMQHIRIIPLQDMGVGGMAIAKGIAKALGTNTQIDDPTEDRQVAQQAWLIKTVEVGDGATTAATVCTGEVLSTVRISSPCLVIAMTILCTIVD